MPAQLKPGAGGILQHQSRCTAAEAIKAVAIFETKAAGPVLLRIKRQSPHSTVLIRICGVAFGNVLRRDELLAGRDSGNRILRDMQGFRLRNDVNRFRQRLWHLGRRSWLREIRHCEFLKNHRALTVVRNINNGWPLIMMIDV